MKRNIPNIITLLNLFAGCIAVVFALEGRLDISAWLIGVAAVMDFLDGFAARLLKVKSAIGKELDSLADVVSFGLVPGAIMFGLISRGSGIVSNEWVSRIIPFAGFIITLFSALRLAKFNTDHRQEEAFYGLPTPANALLIASFPLILLQDKTLAGIQTGFIHEALLNPYVLVSLVIILSLLLVADLRLLSLKFKSAGWKENMERYLLLLFSVIWIILFQFAGIPLIIVTYIILSVSVKA
jgi:CDP-diacylglycerol--serine O-phosphatidyltransferase